jgi:hypothetical protein
VLIEKRDEPTQMPSDTFSLFIHPVRIPSLFDLIPRQKAFHGQGPVALWGLRSITLWANPKIEKISSVVRFPRIRNGNKEFSHPHWNPLLPQSQEKRIKNVPRFIQPSPVLQLPSSSSFKGGKTMEWAVDDKDLRP